jgi:hypothetical protein
MTISCSHSLFPLDACEYLLFGGHVDTFANRCQRTDAAFVKLNTSAAGTSLPRRACLEKFACLEEFA